ncbi:MAG TPA: sigma-70 family RNA polymerase sigma factor [Burkholderiaceae bacterium]|jgi:RNA polymerase sigma-70 factor (ECF subfamily)|nr:sigma-70 family RNA polymerase sigma factor [Burkholderiaceae bacterium]
MQAGSDAFLPPSGLDPEGVASAVERGGVSARPANRVPPPVLTVAVAAASRLATEEPQPPIALTPLSDEEIAGLVAPGMLPGRAGSAPPRDMNPDSDASLMRAYATGDADAFRKLYDRHERSTWRFIRHRLGKAYEPAADDVMQETWISVARAAPRYVPSARFTTWLFAIARGRAIDYLRAQVRSAAARGPADQDAPGDEEGPEGADQLPADRSGEPPVRVESRQQAEAFINALAQLPPLQREAFILHVEGDMTVEEIGQITGVVAETAKTRLRYARARLRSLLADWGSA